MATSLIAGEAKRKHVGLLEVQCLTGQNPKFRFKKLSLCCVRPFIFEDIQLQGSKCGPNESDVREFLQVKVESLIDRAAVDFQDVPYELRQPLIRLKVGTNS